MKYFLLLVIVCISVGEVYGQPLTWQRFYTFDDDRSAYACIEMFNGNYLITGDKFQSSLQLYVVNKWGDIIQTKNYDLLGRMRSIIQLTDSSYLMAGGSIFKVSKTLDSLWFKTYWIDYNKIIQLSDNSYIACGWRGSSYSIGHIAKFNQNGDTLWTKNIDSLSWNKSIRFKDIAYLNDSSIYIAGYIGFDAAGDVLLCKITSNGTIQFIKRFITIPLESISSIMYKDNYLYMTGYKFYYESYLLKSDLNGNLSFIRYYPEATIMGVLNKSGHIIMSGWNDTIFHPAARKLDLNGNELWYRTIYNYHYKLNPSDLFLTSDNGLLMTGYQYDSLIDRTSIYLLRADSNFTIEPVGIEENKNNVNSFQLHQNYPNPFNPITTIKYYIPKAGMIEFKVCDIGGKEIFYYSGYKHIGEYEYEFDASNLSSGVYFYQLKIDDNVITKKMLLLK